VEGDDIDMMEISKGSIFCVCVKTDFIKGLYELSTTVKPDVLLIESTGVANPSDLKRDLKLPIFNGRFDFREQFCLVDAGHFMDAYEVYASLEKQIASSSVFIINKTDTVAPEKIAETKKIIERFHPEPLYFETTYANIPVGRFFELDEKKGSPVRSTDGSPSNTPVLSDNELDQFLDDLLDSPDLEITPPDMLMSVGYRWDGNDINEVREIASALPSSVVRAKGFVEGEGGMNIFNYVMGDWTIEKTDLPRDRIKHENVVVFIGPPDSMAGIETASETGSWSSLGVFQPYSKE